MNDIVFTLPDRVIYFLMEICKMRGQINGSLQFTENLKLSIAFLASNTKLFPKNSDSGKIHSDFPRNKGLYRGR